MNSTDLSSIFKPFDDKISNICGKLALLNYYYQNNKNDCIELNKNLGTIQYLIHNIEQCLNDAENEFEMRSKHCTNLLQLLTDHVDYIEKNLSNINFKEIPSSNSNSNKSMKRNITYINMDTRKIEKKIENGNSRSNVHINKKNDDNSISKRKSSATKKPLSEMNRIKDNSINNNNNFEATSSSSKFPVIKHLTDDELKSIPKYMLGRLTLSKINESIDAFNQTVESKYSFIKKFDLQTSKETEYKRYQNYKSQENSDTKGVYFVTINDIKELSPMKNDSTMRKILICLRHCKRICEIRGGNSNGNGGQQAKLIRYGLI